MAPAIDWTAQLPVATDFVVEVLKTNGLEFSAVGLIAAVGTVLIRRLLAKRAANKRP